MRTPTLLLLLFCTMNGSILAQHDRTDHWRMRYRLFEEERPNIPENPVIFLGNSITEGFDLRFHFPDRKVVNRGINGDHIDGLVKRLDVSVIDLKPERVFILIGINDIGAGDHDSTMITNFTALLDRLADDLPDSDIFVHSILPTGPRWSNCPREKIIRINDRFRNLTRDHNFGWIDLHSHFTDADGYLKEELTSDGLHLNGSGYKLWQQILKNLGLP